MSWRRFCALYAALGPDSLTCQNYDRVRAALGGGGGAEARAWAALTRGGQE